MGTVDILGKLAPRAAKMPEFGRSWRIDEWFIRFESTLAKRPAGWPRDKARRFNNLKDSRPDRDQNRLPLPPLIGRLLCIIGRHDYRIVEVTGGFGGGGSVEKRECRRCQFVSVRQGR